jgi:hypothetical protein
MSGSRITLITVLAALPFVCAVFWPTMDLITTVIVFVSASVSSLAAIAVVVFVGRSPRARGFEVELARRDAKSNP